MTRSNRPALSNDSVQACLMAVKHQAHPSRAASAGNAIVEYITPVALILLAAIGILAALGVGLNNQFALNKQDMMAKINTAQAQEQLHNMQKNAFQAAAAATVKTGGTTNAGGNSTAGLSSADIAKIVQTAGANGATESLASSLTKYIAQLKASGNLTPDQLNILTQLANAGHNMANAEKALQDAVSGGQSTVTYNGQTYPVDDFKEQFGFLNSIGINAVTSMDTTNAMPQLAPFMNLYAQAKASGALNDSAVNDQVTYLSKQIAALSDIAKWNTTKSNTDVNYAYVTAMQQLAIQNAPASVSDATHGDSSGICTTGTGSDSGTSCSN